MHNYPSSQKEASTLAGRLSQIGTRCAWNLSKPDMHSRLAGGVCTAYHARHKGYSDFVQDTGPMISGQLRLVLNEPQTLRGSLRDAQTLRVTFGYSQMAHNSYRVEQILCRRNSRVQIGRNSLNRPNSGESPESNNLLIGLNYRGSREMAKSLISSKSCTAVSRYNLLNVSGNAAGVCRETKHGGSPSLEVPTKNVATCTPGIQWDGKHSFSVNQQVAGKENGNAAHAALWVNSFFNHEGNQHSPDLDDDRKPNLAYEQNQHLAESQNSQNSLRGEPVRLQPSFGQSQNHAGISGEVACLPADNVGTQDHPEVIGEPERLSLSESVNRPSLRGLVQPLRLGVLQLFRKTSNGTNYETFVGHSVAASKPVQPSGVSLDFLRRRRLISVCMEATINCPVLSPSSLTCSIASTTSCGARACTFCDLLFTWSLSIAGFLSDNWNPVYTEKEKEKGFIWIPLYAYTGFQLGVAALNNDEAPQDCRPCEASNHNVTETNAMAIANSSMSDHPKFIWRFFSCQKSVYHSVIATSEREARSQLPDAPCLFAARLPVQEVRHV